MDQVIDKLLEQDPPSPDQLDLGPTPEEKYKDVIKRIEDVIAMLEGEGDGEGLVKRSAVEMEIDNLGLLKEPLGQLFYDADNKLDAAVAEYLDLLRRVKVLTGVRMENE